MSKSGASVEFELQAASLAVCIAVGLPVILWGDPGIGKTSIIQHIARSYGLYLETVIASIREPSDFAGLPYFDNGVMRLAPPAWATNVVAQNTKGIASMVFYDEISTAMPATQAALLRPILEGVVGEIQLPSNTRTVAAANPPRVAANGWDLTPPAANRFVHLDWSMDAITMKNGFQNGWPVIEIPKFPKSFNQMVSNAKIIVGQFIGTHPHLVVKLPENKMRKKETFSASDNAFPTPRAWEMVAKLFAAVKVAKYADGSSIPDGVLKNLLQGAIGDGAATAFYSYAKNLDLPQPKEVLANPESFKNFNEVDKLNVMLSSVKSYVMAYRKHEAYPQLWSKWGDVLMHIHNNGKADVAYSSTQAWNEERPEGHLLGNVQMKSFNSILQEIKNG